MITKLKSLQTSSDPVTMWPYNSPCLKSKVKDTRYLVLVSGGIFLQAILAFKWLASNKCCHGHNRCFSKKLNYSIKEIT